MSAGLPWVKAERWHAPRLSAQVINRQWLADQRQLGQRPVSLVCAPAGCGKTTLVADWARGPGRKSLVSWVTLGEWHNEPARFWEAVIDSVAIASDPDIAEVLARLRPPRRGSEPGFVTSLLDVLDSMPRTQWLVLDDVHHLHSPEALGACDGLVGRAGDSLRLILIGRSDPTMALARLRMSGQVADIRADDLAFSIEESTLMLSRLGVPLAETEILQLHSRTEGWAAGLRLAALSLAETSDVPAAVSSFAGDQRAVADYLFAEVLRQLSDDLREFLLSCCVPDRLNAALARHLSGRTDAGAVLERLTRANVLVTQSADPAWYRFHALLRGYLTAALARQDPEALGRQHRAAAEWLSSTGRPREALIHAVEGGDSQQVVRVVDANGLDLILAGAAPLVLRSVAAAPLQVQETSSVAIIAALAALDAADLLTADAYLARIADEPAGEGRSRRLHGCAVVQRALAGGDVAQALKRTGMTAWQRSPDAGLDLMIWAYRGPARMRIAEYQQAIEDLEYALDLAERGGYDELGLWTLSQLSGISGAACDFEGMKAWSDRAIDFARPRGWGDSPRLAYAYLLAAWTGFQTGDAEAQTRYAARAIDCLDAVTNVEVDLGVRSMSALASFEANSGDGRYQAARDFHQIWQGPTAEQASPALIGFASPQEVRMALAVGETDWATTAAQRVARQLPDSAESIVLQATLILAKGRTTDALNALEPVLRNQVICHVRTTIVAADLVAWQLYERSGSSARAHEALTRALTWAAPRNFRRPFLDVAVQLRPVLAADAGRFGRADAFAAAVLRDLNREPSTTPASVAMRPNLTATELKILRELPSMLDVAHIADSRGVSLNTIKSHVTSIYRKLGVAGRREAVMEARRLGLI